MNWVSYYSWKSHRLEMTHGNRLLLFLLPILILSYMKFITLPIYRLPILLSETKEGFKAPWTWCFPCTSGAAPVTQPGTSRIRNIGPKYRNFHVFMTLLRVLPTPSLHIVMVTYCNLCRTPIIERAKLHVTKYTGYKIRYKIDKFAFEGNKSKVVRGTVLT